MWRIGIGRTPGLPYLGTFPETNVRLYSVDGSGPARRGVPVAGVQPARAGGGRAVAVPVAVHVGGHVDRARRRRHPLPVAPALATRSGPPGVAPCRSVSARASSGRGRWKTSSPPAGDCTIAGTARTTLPAERASGVAAAPRRGARPGRRARRGGRTAGPDGRTGQRAVLAGRTRVVRSARSGRQAAVTGGAA